MYQYNYSRAMDNNNNNNNGRGRGFSGFPTMINTSYMPRPPINLMFPNSLVSANYRANDARIANSAIPNANYGMMMPMSKVHGEASCICSSMRNIHEPGLIDPNMNGFIRLHPNHSVEWKEEGGKQIGIVTRNLDPRLSSANNNIKSMHSFEVMLSSKAPPPHANAFAINDGAQQALTHGSIPLEDAAVAENGSDESRKRKRENMVIQHGMLARSSSLDGPRTVVRIESQEDILDDGYSWRKYGQKMIKGNSHGPRCYYRCNISGCSTRKQVERCAADARYVITTYDGKHSHEVPPPKGKNKIRYYHEYAEFPTPPAQQLNNNVTFMVPNMVATLSDHAESSSSATPHAAGGSAASASSATDAVPPPPFLFDLNLPPPQELDDN